MTDKMKSPMPEKMKAGIAFLVIGFLTFSICLFLLSSMKTDVIALINVLPASDPSMDSLNKVLDKIGYAVTLMTVSPAIIFGVGYAYLNTGLKQKKG